LSHEDRSGKSEASLTETTDGPPIDRDRIDDEL